MEQSNNLLLEFRKKLHNFAFLRISVTIRLRYQKFETIVLLSHCLKLVYINQHRIFSHN